MNSSVRSFIFGLLLLAGSQIAVGQEKPSFEDRMQNMESHTGYFDLFWDQKQGHIYLEIEHFGDPFLYVSSMARGIGSNDLGLDRGQLGSKKLVEFFRSGPKVLLIENNLGYQADTDNQAEREAVESSFARSVIWGFKVVHEEENSVVVDATDFFLRDSHGLTQWLSNARQGSFKADATRSAIYLPRTRSFPDNTEIEAMVTFTGSRKFDENGQAVSNILPTVVPDSSAITVHFHHSLIRLPDDNYTPIHFDPRSGLFGGGYLDYGSQIGDPLKVMYTRRHRLEKKNPEAETSEAVEPIIYYVDPGAPEPIRSALIEGAAWWNQAFEAAGYINAFQVKVLPENADPMDVRYNVIQWVHRSTRGWSYGDSVVDPRTGEILKGHVSLGSLRVRQDYLIAEGLLGPYGNESIPDEMLEMSLARIRQLSAHEVGHTIGLAHNFAASVNNRASVMDYPFPLIKFDEAGELDLSDAYGVGIGDWDKRVVLFGYQDFPESVNEDKARAKIMQETIASGLLFIADSDSRDPGSAHPFGNLWDNGGNAIDEFNHLLDVRAHALSNFGDRNIRNGRPLADIEEVLVPLYLIHRFQIHAVGKLIGGQYYSYNMRGDGQDLPETVSADRQKTAIDTLLDSLSPEILVLPQSLVDQIPARPPGHSLSRESFSRSTGILFDRKSPAASAVSLTLDVLLDGRRAARMNSFHAETESNPDFAYLLDSLIGSSFKAKRLDGMEGSIQRSTADQVLGRLMNIMSDAQATHEVRAQALTVINSLDEWLSRQSSKRLEQDWASHYDLARHEIDLLLSDSSRLVPLKSTVVPPGGPIGN